MKIEDFFTRLEEEYEDVAPGTLKPESVFREAFNWCSINAVILIALIKTEYNVDISADDIAQSETVGDLFRIIMLQAHQEVAG
jgi:acyl carrier protein